MLRAHPRRSLFALTALLVAAAALALPQEAPKPAPPKEAPKDAPKDDSAKGEKDAKATKAPTPRERAKDIKEITGTFVMADGATVAFKLEPNKCPLLCANFCNLARKGFFDGREWDKFSRVVRQIGTETLYYTLPREFDPSLFFDKGGLLVMSKDREESANAKAAGTRLFVTVKNQERWNLDFPPFGRLTNGLQVMIDLKQGDKLQKITVEGDVDNLLKVFAPEIEGWNKELEEAVRKGWK